MYSFFALLAYLSHNLISIKLSYYNLIETSELAFGVFPTQGV